MRRSRPCVIALAHVADFAGRAFLFRSAHEQVPTRDVATVDACHVLVLKNRGSGCALGAGIICIGADEANRAEIPLIPPAAPACVSLPFGPRALSDRSLASTFQNEIDWPGSGSCAYDGRGCPYYFYRITNCNGQPEWPRLGPSSGFRDDRRWALSRSPALS